MHEKTIEIRPPTGGWRPLSLIPKRVGRSRRWSSIWTCGDYARSSFQEDAIGIRLRDVIGVVNMMWGSDYPHSESTFPQSRKILAEILAGVPDDEQAKIAGITAVRVYNFDAARLTAPA
jgi:hypothetical protein